MIVPDEIAAAVAAAALLGLRHGVDHAHIAAIAGLSGPSPRPPRAVGLAMLYGAGHSLTVFALGALAIAFGLAVPHRLDLVMRRVVGITLVLLGGYVLHAVFRHADHRHVPTRIELLACCWHWVQHKFLVSEHDHVHEAMSPSGPGGPSAFVVGVVHGIGAETPTQLGVFVIASGVGGWAGGLLCVGAFATGLLTINLLMALLSAGVFNFSTARERIYRVVMLATGAYSVVLGAAFLLGLHFALL
ncbi:MAG: hypothetical protein ACREQB_11015 [Candidatus Binataceae bacterium]